MSDILTTEEIKDTFNFFKIDSNESYESAEEFSKKINPVSITEFKECSIFKASNTLCISTRTQGCDTDAILV
jgi:hypothetical protein